MVAARRPSAGKIAALGEQWNVGRMVKSLAGAIVRQARLGKEINPKAAANLPDNAGNRARPGPKRMPETAVAGEGLMGADGEARGV